MASSSDTTTEDCESSATTCRKEYVGQNIVDNCFRANTECQTLNANDV